MKYHSSVSCICMLLVLVAKVPGQSESRNPISWKPNAVSEIIFPGVPMKQQVSFVSTLSLGKVTLFVVPELRPYVTVDPGSIDVVAGVTNTVTLYCSAQATAQEDTIFGMISVRVGSHTYPQTVKINLIIGGASIVNSVLHTSEAAVDSVAHWCSVFGSSKARNLALNWLNGQENVDSAGYTDNKQSIWIWYTGGLPGVLMTGPPGTLGSPMARTAAIISPLFSDPVVPGNLECNFVSGKLRGSCVAVDVLQRDNAVTLDFLKGLHGYGVISLWTHGTLWRDALGRDQVVLMTGQQVLSFSTMSRELMADWLSGRIVLAPHRLGPIPIPTNTWFITPSFIRYYAQPQYPGSLVTVSACHSMDNLTMASAFLDNGVSTYLGWTNNVSPGFALNKKAVFYSRLVDEFMSARGAFNAWTIEERTDPTADDDGRHAVLMKVDRDDLTLCPSTSTFSWQETNFPSNPGLVNAILSANGYIFADHSAPPPDVGVYRSNDNGVNWVHTTLSFPVYSLAANSLGQIFAGTNGSGVYMSSDNGETWIPKNNGLANVYGLSSIIFNNSGYIFAGGGGNGYGGVYRSIDNGNNWTKVLGGISDSYLLSLGTNLNGHIFAASQSYGVYRSTDNGDSWAHVLSPQPYLTDAVAISPSGDIFVGSYLRTYRSTDNGNNWTELTNGIGGSMRSILFHGPNIYAGSFCGGVFLSQDNGNTWAGINSGLSDLNVLSLCLSSSGHLFAGTYFSKVFRSSNQIGLLKPGNVDSVTNAAIPVDFILEQNYPNPFNPTTRINYALSHDAFATLRIFDVLGREVAILVNERQMAGHHTAVFKGSNLPTGVYFYRLQNENYDDTKRMILLK